MPALTFILPHWLYWAGLGLFPLVAMVLVRRQRRQDPGPRGPNLFLAGLFWLLAGFLGMHRFYLRSLVGFVFIPVFLAILYGNGQIREAREDVSRTHAQTEQATRELERAEARSKADDAAGPAAVLASAREEAARARAEAATAQARLERWRSLTQGTALVLAAMLLVDAALLPRLVRRRRAAEAAVAAPRMAGPPPGPEANAEAAAAVPVMPAPPVPQAGTGEDPTLGRPTRFTGWIDSLNAWVGEYVAYWAVVAVFVYYYEVVARYVFNSPTNWVHESMFLMFGMQYMLSGAFAYRDDSHVRVDIVYARLSPRGKATCDVITSVFFFIFTITLLVTGWRFASDAIAFDEHSFTEWGIQYWPVKLAIPIGAALIVLQGFARLARDIALLRAPKGA